MSVSEQFRTLIRESGVSRYRLAKESAGRLHQSELASFLAGRSRLGLAKLDIVAELLGVPVLEPVSELEGVPVREGVSVTGGVLVTEAVIDEVKELVREAVEVTVLELLRVLLGVLVALEDPVPLLVAVTLPVTELVRLAVLLLEAVLDDVCDGEGVDDGVRLGDPVVLALCVMEAGVLVTLGVAEMLGIMLLNCSPRRT